MLGFRTSQSKAEALPRHEIGIVEEKITRYVAGYVKHLDIHWKAKLHHEADTHEILPGELVWIFGMENTTILVTPVE